MILTIIFNIEPGFFQEETLKFTSKEEIKRKVMGSIREACSAPAPSQTEKHPLTLNPVENPASNDQQP